MKDTLTQSTKASFIMDSVLLIGGLPLMSSKSMMPCEYTSDFSVNFPLDAYSGAKYL